MSVLDAVQDGGRRPRVLVFADYYEPGFRAGGPIRAINALVELTADEFDFRIITRSHEPGERTPLPGIVENQWNRRGAASVFYAAPDALSLASLLRRITEASPQLIVLNSMFSRLTLRVLLLRRGRRIGAVPVVVAPRGELAATALDIKRVRKRVYLRFAERARLYARVVWQASSEHELRDIDRFRARLGSAGAPLMLAPEIPQLLTGTVTRNSPKEPGHLNAIFLSRIARIKNLDGLLRMLSSVRGRVDLEIRGPCEDARYWAECQQLIGALPPSIRVHYGGTVEPAAVPRLLAEHDALLLPTHGENFGHVIPEALGAGCPVVISDRTPWRELAAAGAGWDLPLAEPARFTAAIETLVAMDETGHARLRSGARAYVWALYEGRDVIGATRAVFRTALGTARAAGTPAGDGRPTPAARRAG